jgi:hypothetical protein
MKEGVEITKIDKGCLIINTETEGYDVLLFDNQNRGEEAVYWKEKFLNVKPQKMTFIIRSIFYHLQNNLLQSN